MHNTSICGWGCTTPRYRSIFAHGITLASCQQYRISPQVLLWWHATNWQAANSTRPHRILFQPDPNWPPFFCIVWEACLKSPLDAMPFWSEARLPCRELPEYPLLRPEALFPFMMELNVSKIFFWSLVFDPPVHFARWAHMRHFLSVCVTFWLDQKYWIIIHFSESIYLEVKGHMGWGQRSHGSRSN